MANGRGLRALRGPGGRFGTAIRGCRCAQPPANGWEAFGLGEENEISCITGTARGLRAELDFTRIGHSFPGNNLFGANRTCDSLHCALDVRGGGFHKGASWAAGIHHDESEWNAFYEYCRQRTQGA